MMKDIVNRAGFIHVISGGQADIAGEMSEEIKKVIFKYEKQVPLALALALGVLAIVGHELIEDST